MIRRIAAKRPGVFVYHHGRPSAMVGGLPGQEAKRMSQKELNDNLTFLSALRLLEQLTVKGILNAEEANQARAELEQRLRPTLLFI